MARKQASFLRGSLFSSIIMSIDIYTLKELGVIAWDKSEHLDGEKCKT